MSDQERISPYNIMQTSNENKYKIININHGIITWSKTKFSKPMSQELYGRQLGELLQRSWEWNDQSKHAFCNFFFLQTVSTDFLTQP